MIHFVNLKLNAAFNIYFSQIYFRVSMYQIIGEINQIIGEINQIIGEINQIIGEINQIIGDINQIIGDITQIIGEINHIIGKIDHITGENNNPNKVQRFLPFIYSSPTVTKIFPNVQHITSLTI